MKTTIHILNKTLAFVILILCILISSNSVDSVWLSSILVILQILLVIEYSKFKPFALFVLFAITYTIPAHLHFVDNRYLLKSELLEFSDYSYNNGVFVVLSLFWAVFTILLPKLKDQIILREYLVVRDNATFFYIVSTIFLLVIVFGKSGDSIFSSGGYGQGAVTQAGGVSLYEYGGFLFLIAYCFTGKNRIRTIILISLASFYCFKSLLLGGRINTLFMLLLIFILYLDNRKTSMLKWAFIGAPVVAFFLIFSFIRGNVNDGLDGLTTTLEYFEGKYFINSFLLGNQTDVFYSSARLYAFCEMGILTPTMRLETFFYNMAAFVVPYGKLPEVANLAAYRSQEYYAGGGSLMPIFFYVYLSYYGVALIAIILGLIFRRMMKSPNKVSNNFTVYIIALMASFGTWYAYSANNLYKYCVYGVIAYALTNVAYNLTTSKPHKKIEEVIN